MTSNSAYAPYLQTYGQTVPYLTADEYQRAPTAVDVGNLVSGGPQSQLVALTETIARASSWIDQYVTGSAYNTLCATINTENARVWGNRNGQLIVHPKLWPILEVQSFSYSVPGAAFSGASITPSGNIWIEPQQFIVQPNTVYGWNAFTGAANYGGAGGWQVGITTGEYLCEWAYVNGFPNTTLTASVAAGAASVSVDSGIGIYPNTQLTLFDAPYDEYVTVASNYVPNTSLVPLTAPLAYNHAVNSSITNLPNSVKQAAILLTTAFVKQRGSGALVAQDMGVISHTESGTAQNGQDDIGLAQQLLAPFRQRFIGY